VECFEGLLDSDATLLQLVQPSAVYNRPVWSAAAAAALTDASAELVAHIAEMHNNSDTTDNTSSKEAAAAAVVDSTPRDADDDAAVAAEADAVAALLLPLLSSALVPCLSPEAVLFVFDQGIMGGFGQILPLLAAMVAAALAPSLLGCTDWNSMQVSATLLMYHITNAVFRYVVLVFALFASSNYFKLATA
jgi:hypothetical protein